MEDPVDRPETGATLGVSKVRRARWYLNRACMYLDSLRKPLLGGVHPTRSGARPPGLRGAVIVIAHGRC